jgi:RluA family pseudouridine synthase
MPDAERFDPAVTRVGWRTAERQPFSQLVDELRSRLGHDEARVQRVLHHRGLQLDGRPVGLENAPAEIEAGTRVVAWALACEPEEILVSRNDVVFDELGVVAVVKPPWLPVQGTRASAFFSLEHALRGLLACPALRAVHRLDRETSGLTLFARDAATASFLGRALAARRIERSYLAVVAPPPPEESFEVEGTIVRVADPSRFRFALTTAPAVTGRRSHTRFARLAVRHGRALLRAEPTTGRTHQIRVHLSALGCPIVGDRLYGDASEPGAGRLLLHAARLELPLPPPASRSLVLEEPAPADFGPAGWEATAP